MPEAALRPQDDLGTASKNGLSQPQAASDDLKRPQAASNGLKNLEKVQIVVFSKKKKFQISKKITYSGIKSNSKQNK